LQDFGGLVKKHPGLILAATGKASRRAATPLVSTFHKARASLGQDQMFAFEYAHRESTQPQKQD
jgi:hypothetical protein